MNELGNVLLVMHTPALKLLLNIVIHCFVGSNSEYWLDSHNKILVDLSLSTGYSHLQNKASRQQIEKGYCVYSVSITLSFAPSTDRIPSFNA